MRKALHAALDDERRDAARAGRRIGLGVNDEGFGEGTVGDPHFRAIDDVAVALAFGRVVIDTTSEPAFGSDIASAPICSPEMSLGR